MDKRTKRNSKEHTCPTSLREPHLNYNFFVGHGTKRDLKKVLSIANPSEAARFNVSPEFHFARLLRTSDNALNDGELWKRPAVFDQWYIQYKHELDALIPPKDKETRLLEFLAADAQCKFGYGETPLSRAGSQAQKGTPPTELKDIQNQQLSKLACFCRELARQDEYGEMRFFLSCRDAAKIAGSEDAMAGHRLLNALCALRVLKITRKGRKGKSGRASRFRYIASDAQTDD